MEERDKERDLYNYKQLTLVYRITWVVGVILLLIGLYLITISEREPYRVDEETGEVLSYMTIYPYDDLGLIILIIGPNLFIAALIIRYIRNKKYKSLP